MWLSSLMRLSVGGAGFYQAVMEFGEVLGGFAVTFRAVNIFANELTPIKFWEFCAFGIF